MDISFLIYFRTWFRKSLWFIQILVVAIGFVACSKSTIKTTEVNPPVFHTSGYRNIVYFQVVSDKEQLWTIFPNAKDVSMSEIGSIKYGEIPPNWTQEFPKNTAPPPLVEGTNYQAFAVVLSANIVRLHFTIKNGKVVELVSTD